MTPGPRCPRRPRDGGPCASDRFTLVAVRRQVRHAHWEGPRWRPAARTAAVSVRLRCDRCGYYWWSGAAGVVAWARTQRAARIAVPAVPRPRGGGMERSLPTGDR